MAEQTHIIIKPDGQIVLEGIGHTGNSCTKDSASLEDLLGTVICREFKPAYHQSVQQIQSQQIQQ